MGKFHRKNRILVFGFKPEGRVGDYQIKQDSRSSFCVFLVPVQFKQFFWTKKSNPVKIILVITDQTFSNEHWESFKHRT